MSDTQKIRARKTPKNMKARKTRKKIQARKKMKAPQARKVRKKWKAREKQRHEGTQACKARRHMRYVRHEGTRGT